jgi:hypothetical protein
MRNLVMRKLLVLTVAVLAVCLAVGSQSALAGTLFNVDCNTSTSPTMSGAAVLGTSGDSWNSYVGQSWGPSNEIPIMDSAGSYAAGVSIDIWNYYGTSDNTGGTTPNPITLMEDYINAYGVGDGFPIRAEFRGLPASAAFELVVYSAGDASGQGATVTLYDGPWGSSPSPVSSETTSATSRDIDDGEGVAYVVFTGTTSSTGTVFIEAANTADWHSLNGLQIDVVPEPATIVLLALAAAMLLLRRRR